jgi:hypothetical protein
LGFWSTPGCSGTVLLLSAPSSYKKGADLVALIIDESPMFLAWFVVWLLKAAEGRPALPYITTFLL